MIAYPGDNASSDHNQLTARIKLKFKKLSKPNSICRIGTRQLLIKNTLEEIQYNIHINLDKRNKETEDIDEVGEFLQQCILQRCEEMLQKPREMKND